MIASRNAPPSKTPRGPALGSWTDWDRFLEATPCAGFMQSSWWAEFRATAGYRNFGLVLRDNGAIMGGATVLRFPYAPGRCFYYVPEGPVLPDDPEDAAGVFRVLLAAIERHRGEDDERVSHLRIEPRWSRLPAFVTGFRPVPDLADRFAEPRNTRCIDLRPPEEEILAQMKPKGRYNIRLAHRHGVTVVEDPSDTGVADFCSIYDATARRKGMDAKPCDYFADLVSLLSVRGAGSLFFAEHGGERIGAAIVVRFGQRATYFFGGSLPQRREVMAPYLLHFEIMRWARAGGAEWYDLWGIAPEGLPHHPWSDISAFKGKFGGIRLDLVPTLDRVYDGDAYGRYLEAASA